MADKENFSEFGIDIGLSASGFDSVLAKFKHLASEGEKIGKTTNEITEAMKRLKAAMEHSLNVDTANKGRSLFSETDPAKRRILSQQIANNVQKLNTLQSAAAKAENDILNPAGKKTKIEDLVGAVSKLGVAWTSVWASTKTIRMMYRWVDGIAQMNMQLRMLHYSSGLGIESLKSFGNAAALYGGSAATVSSYEEQYQMQISRAKRGLGLGNLEEAAWQYGFRFDANENAQERFERAIKEMRSGKIGREDWRAFSQLIAPGRVKELMAWANRSSEARKEYLEYMEEVAAYKTFGDKNLAKAVSKKSEELAEAQGKLAAEFGAVKDQFADVLIPVLQVFVDGAAKVCRWFNRLDPAWKSVWGGLSALAATAFSLALAWGGGKKLLRGIGSAIGGGIASGMGGGFAGGVGKTAGGIAGGVGGLVGKMNPIGIVSGVVDAIAGGVQRQIQIGSLFKLEQVVSAWYQQWRFTYMLSGGAITGEKGIAAMMEKGVDEQTALLIARAARNQRVSKEQQHYDNKALYERIGEIVAVMQSGENAQTVRATSYIGGNVQTNNDNRQLTVNQTFVSSGNVQTDVETAKSEMGKLDLLDSTLNH